MKIPLLDLKAQYIAISSSLHEALDRVASSQVFIRGPELEACEQELASYSGAKHGVGVSNCSDAIYLALTALGVGPGDEVITTGYSFFATAESIVRTGATPVFVDIDNDMLLDPQGIPERLGPKTKAILCVHLFGRCVDPKSLEQVAPGIPIVEDAAQAVGAAINGERAGSLGVAGCFSFFPSKNLGCWGDGGMVTTSDATLATEIEALREHGRDPDRRYVHQSIGGNYRLDALQAAIVRAKLPYLDGWASARRKNAALYTELFSESGLPIIPPPSPDPRHEDVYNQYVIRVPAQRRDSLRAHLTAHDIGTAVYYPMALHLQPCLDTLGHHRGDLPKAEQCCLENLALPVFPELGESRLRTVAKEVISFMGS